MRDLRIARGLLACLAIAIVLVSCDDGPSAPFKPVSERDALVALYNATDGDDWVHNTNWLTDAPIDTWRGVETDSSGKVVALNLERNGLNGGIPAELGSLSALRWLILQSNGLSGEIPAELGNLTNLRFLWLSTNWLNGKIPPVLGGLPYLESLGLSDNGLSGEVPAELANLSNLTSLGLSSNRA